MRNELIDQIKNLEREVRELKDAGRQSGLLKCYSYRIDNFLGLHFKVVYDDGTQPIISEFYYNGSIMPFRPDLETNEQRFNSYAQATMPLTIIATRPILRVVNLDVASDEVVENS